MNDEIVGNRGSADQDSAEPESAPEQPTNAVAELSATESRFPVRNPRPLSNPKITVQS
jgi:hypothetical protein